MSKRIKTLCLAAAMIAVIGSSAARANGFKEDAPWAFQSPSGLAAQVGAAILQQQVMHGSFGPSASAAGASSPSLVTNTSIGNQTVVSATGSNVTVNGTQSNNGSTQHATTELNGTLTFK